MTKIIFAVAVAMLTLAAGARAVALKPGPQAKAAGCCATAGEACGTCCATDCSSCPECADDCGACPGCDDCCGA